MKKQFRNTVSIFLLVFYLAGFCGLNLLKHSCFSCHQEDYHLIYDLDKCGDEMHVCEADSRPHLISFHSDSSHAHYAEVPCCTLELIYLKNNPQTLIKQVVKSPLISSLDLFQSTCLQLHLINDSSKGDRIDYLKNIVDPPEITQDLLSCYRC